MTIKQALFVGTALGVGLIAVGTPSRAQQASPAPASTVATPAIDDNDIGGIVTSRLGPEGGVWVIAETTDLGTRFAKMAVTDDYGRYVIPDLPKAHYRIWVRGYGLVDFGESDGRTRQDAQPDRHGGAESCGGGAVLPGDLLGRHDPNPRQEPIPRYRR